MITKNGVYYDLENSSYRCKVNGLTFVFSSKLHLDKFKSKMKENREKINKSLSNRFNILVDVEQLADVVLYRKIETRGFLILSVEGSQLCPRNLIFQNGEVKINNFND